MATDPMNHISAADLKAMAQDIKQSVTEAIADLHSEIHIMNTKVTTMEASVQHHDIAAACTGQTLGV